MAFGEKEERLITNMHEEDGCTRRIVKGLRNVGNSCFFNSVMQNLLAVDGLRDHFMKPAEFPEGPITSALRELYVKTSSEEPEEDDDFDYLFSWLKKVNNALSPKVLFSAICEKVPQFRGFRQQDSHELLRCLLDNLNLEELQCLSNSIPTNCEEAAEGNTDESSSQRHKATLVNRIFHGQLCSTVTCSKCGYQSGTYEPFHDLSLPIPNKSEPVKFSLPQQEDPSSSKTELENSIDNPLSDSSLPNGSESPLPMLDESEVLLLPYKEMDSMTGEDDNLLSATEYDYLFSDLPVKSKNVQGVENQYVEDTIAKSDFGLLGGAESPLSHKQMDSVAGEELEVTDMSAGFNTDDPLEVSFSSLIDRDPSNDICHLFDEGESSVVQEKKEELAESNSLLYGENDGDNLFMGMSATTEMDEDETESAVNPMSVDSCLVEFTRIELLSGENGWKCPNCASKLVNGSDNLENMTTKEGRGMGINYRLNAGSMQNTSDYLVDQRVKDTKLEVFTSARHFETSDKKTDESKLHNGSVTGTGAGLSDNDIDDGQPSNREGHQLRRIFSGQDSVSIHDYSGQVISCSHAEGHSNKNVLRISGSEDSSEIDGVNQVERPLSTSSEEEGSRISTNLGKWDLKSQKFRSCGEGHTLKKRKSKTREHEANSNAIIHEATKRYLISEAPHILTIHLKRFKQSIFDSFSKWDGHVAFEERLNLRPYLDPRCHDKDSCVYRLIGVVEHQGTMVFGHYVAYVRGDQDGSGFQWFYASDSHVNEVSLREVLGSEAYILFYEKCKVC